MEVEHDADTGRDGPAQQHGTLPRFAVVDIETSGLSLRRHRILQIALVEVADGAVVGEWSTLVKLRWPWQRVGPRRVHGITRRSLRHAPDLATALADLAARLEGTVFVAHNAAFDWAFIARAADRTGTPVPPISRLCTLHMSRRLDPDRARSHRLADLCERYGVANDRPHDALFDARATAAILPHLLAAHAVTDAEALGALYERDRR